MSGRRCHRGTLHHRRTQLGTRLFLAGHRIIYTRDVITPWDTKTPYFVPPPRRLSIRVLPPTPLSPIFTSTSTNGSTLLILPLLLLLLLLRPLNSKMPLGLIAKVDECPNFLIPWLAICIFMSRRRWYFPSKSNPSRRPISPQQLMLLRWPSVLPSIIEHGCTYQPWFLQQKFSIVQKILHFVVLFIS